MNRKLLILIIVFFNTSCAPLTHFHKLLVLKGLADNHDGQAKYIVDQDKKFQALLEAIRNNSLSEFRSQASVLRTFGDPVYTKKVIKEGKPLERWLYRYSLKLINSERVYLYFNDSKRLVRSEHIPAAE